MLGPRASRPHSLNATLANPPDPTLRSSLQRQTKTDSHVLSVTPLDIVVGARGFEPPTSRSRTERSTRLSHAPTSSWIIGKRSHPVKLTLNSLTSFLAALPSSSKKTHGIFFQLYWSRGRLNVDSGNVKKWYSSIQPGLLAGWPLHQSNWENLIVLLDEHLPGRNLQWSAHPMKISLPCRSPKSVFKVIGF